VPGGGPADSGGSAGPKPYEFIGFGSIGASKSYKFIRFGAIAASKSYKFRGFVAGPGVARYFRVPGIHLYMLFEPAGSRRFWGSGRPRRPQKPFQKMGGIAARMGHQTL